MINIVITDRAKLKYELLQHLSEEVEKNISDNINSYNDKYKDHYIQIETIDSIQDIHNSELKTWTLNQALYDSLILRYNKHS